METKEKLKMFLSYQNKLLVLADVIHTKVTNMIAKYNIHSTNCEKTKNNGHTNRQHRKTNKNRQANKRKGRYTARRRNRWARRQIAKKESERAYTRT